MVRNMEKPQTHHFIVDGRSGTKLSTLDLRSAVISFVKEINPEFHIKPKDIRRYVRGRICESDGNNTFEYMEPKDF